MLSEYGASGVRIKPAFVASQIREECVTFCLSGQIRAHCDIFDAVLGGDLGFFGPFSGCRKMMGG